MTWSNFDVDHQRMWQ